MQNFTQALLLHPHFHVLVPEGVFVGEGHTFEGVPPPQDEEVLRLLRRVARLTMKLANARFPDGLPYAKDAWEVQLRDSSQTRMPLPEGQSPAPATRRRCAWLDGFSLHADTRVHENDKQGLERLCRYGARGPLSQERLSLREDGKLEYRLKKPSRGGAMVLVLTPLQLVKRLCPLVVAPKVHLTRFFGVFAPNSAARPRVLPAPPKSTLQAEHAQGCGPSEKCAPALVPPKLDWAGLLRRTFDIDVLRCPCGGERKVLAVISSPDVARKILGLPPSRPDSRLTQRPVLPTGPPQLSLL